MSNDTEAVLPQDSSDDLAIANEPRPYEANPPRGQKGGFIRFTCTLDPVVYQHLAAEATQRKIDKKANPIISAIIRDALVAYFGLTGETTVPPEDEALSSQTP